MGLIRHSTYEIGIDEAGRGCLAGPVVAASFMPLGDFKAPKGLNDSKKMTTKQRDYCYEYVTDNYPNRYAVASVDNNVIDNSNILMATMAAMRHSIIDNTGFILAVDNDDVRPSIHLLIDGNRFSPVTFSPPHHGIIPYETVIKGDSIYESIAMASVIAKVYRDKLMVECSKLPQFAMYGWDKNKSYCTKDHIAAIIKHGRSPLHRQTFKVPGYDR